MQTLGASSNNQAPLGTHANFSVTAAHTAEQVRVHDARKRQRFLREVDGQTRCSVGMGAVVIATAMNLCR